nr:chondroitin sulfate synthase 3-like isoform X1 [Ciona intestinalis]|eukprot:XP_002131646.1 chondroitin sulfate synthase 3-like isoform X1 [Ciona intestinalis]
MSALKQIRNSQNVQFIFSFCVGWFVLGHFWTEEMDKAFKRGELNVQSYEEHCSCDHLAPVCPPCNGVVDVQSQRQQNIKISESYYRTYKYKPLAHSEDLTNRWRMLTHKHQYEMINQEPRVGLNGMWRVEVNQAEQQAKHIAIKNGAESSIEMKEIFQRVDAFHGTTYIVNYEAPDAARTVVEMNRPYIAGKPKLVSVDHVTNREIINIISPISKVSERFNNFLSRYEDNVLSSPSSGPVRIIFVIFQPDDEHEVKYEDSVSHITDVLDKFRARNKRAMIEYIFTKGEFNRAVGLHAGVMQCNDDEIVLFLDVDLKIGGDFLGRVRRNVVQHERAIFPIMFSQYDSDVMKHASTVDMELVQDVEDPMQINKQTGFWIYYAFGVAAMYKSDYLKVGGFRLDIKGWGGEDVDLFKKMISDPHINVMSIVDADLMHIYHKRGCDVTLAPDQYAMCVGAWAETLGSQRQVGTLYLNKHYEL